MSSSNKFDKILFEKIEFMLLISSTQLKYPLKEGVRVVDALNERLLLASFSLRCVAETPTSLKLLLLSIRKNMSPAIC